MDEHVHAIVDGEEVAAIVLQADAVVNVLFPRKLLLVCVEVPHHAVQAQCNSHLAPPVTLWTGRSSVPLRYFRWIASREKDAIRMRLCLCFAGGSNAGEVRSILWRR